MERVDWDQRYIDADTPWDSGVPSEALKNLVDSGLVKPCRVLELGCGTGTNAIFLAQSGFEVTAVDLSQTALASARSKAQQAGVSISFLEADVTKLPSNLEPFAFVFDRGTYHIVRTQNLADMQEMLSQVIAPGGLYVVLAGNANEDAPADKGPPRVTAHDICKELESDSFDLVSLEETHFHGVKIAGEVFAPLAWKVILRRRHSPR